MFCHEACRAPLRKPCRSAAVPVLHVVPPSHFVPFAPPPVSGEATLFRAYRMCARARVCAGAVRAPDCARGANAGRTSPVRSVGVFFAPVRGRRRNGPRMPLPPCLMLPQIPQGQALFGNYFIICERRAGRGAGFPHSGGTAGDFHVRAVRCACRRGAGLQSADGAALPEAPRPGPRNPPRPPARANSREPSLFCPIYSFDGSAR